MTIAAAILARHQRYGWSDPPGEWGHVQSEHRKPLREALDAGDEPALDALLYRMFQSPITHGLVSVDMSLVGTPEFDAETTRAMNDSLAIWAAHTDATMADLARLHAPPFGSPAVVELPGGIQIMPDTPRHDHYARRICSLMGPGGTVIEIGGGYGGTALQVLRRDPGAHVVLADLPETLYLAWWWLTRAGADVLWSDEDGEARIVLVPLHEIEAAEDEAPTADVIFSAHSLSEMTPEVVGEYMRWVHYMGPRYFYHDNARMSMKAPEGAQSTAGRWPEVLCSQMVPGAPYREVYRAPTMWPPAPGRYWEYLYERAGS